MSDSPKRRVLVADPHAADRLLDALRGRARGQTALVRVTRGDAVAMTGLPSAQAEPALKALAKDYRSHLAVTDEGELVWAFDPSFARRDAVPLAERLRHARQALWRGFQAFFKVWIAVTLVVYVVAFVAMMIALLFARSSDDRDDRRGGGDGGLFWLWWWLMPDWAPAHGDPYGRTRRPPRKRPAKRFYQSVFDFVFGPKEAPVDPREADRRLIAFLRDKKGRIAASELAALTGLPLDEAEQELTRLMAEYDGEVEIADDGSLLYVFDELLVSAGAPTGETWRWSWDTPERERPLTGNEPGTNVAVGGFAVFNLIASLTVGPAFLAKMGWLDIEWARLLVVSFPLAFSTLFLGIPGVRALQAKRARKKALGRRVRRELLREIYDATERGDGSLDPEVAAARVAERTGVEPALARRTLDRVLAELEGDVTTDDAGKMRYAFPRLVEEKKAIAGARAGVKQLPRLGQVVFSSEDERPAAGADPTASESH